MPAATYFCYHPFSVLKSISLPTWESNQHNVGLDSLPLYIKKGRTCLTTSICCCNTLQCTLAYIMGQLHRSHVLVSNQGTKTKPTRTKQTLKQFPDSSPFQRMFQKGKNPRELLAVSRLTHIPTLGSSVLLVLVAVVFPQLLISLTKKEKSFFNPLIQGREFILHADVTKNICPSIWTNIHKHHSVLLDVSVANKVPTGQKRQDNS